MIELPFLIVVIAVCALVYLGFAYTRHTFVIDTLAGQVAIEQELVFKQKEVFAKMYEALEIMSAAHIQQSSDEILDREDIDAYQLLGKFAIDLQDLADSCRIMSQAEYVEIDYDNYDEDQEGF